VVAGRAESSFDLCGEIIPVASFACEPAQENPVRGRWLRR
jgi:hypothetical protein